MGRGTRKPKNLKVRKCTDRLIGINEHLDAFHGSKASDNIGETEFNVIFLNNIPNESTKQIYVKGFIINYYL